MNAGDSFFLKITGDDYDPHLWVVISDPRKDGAEFLIVNLTTWHPEHLALIDDSCVLQKGDHPFVKHPTWINYQHARVIQATKFAEWDRFGMIVPHKPFSDVILNRIRKGAEKSKRLARSFKLLLAQQGLIALK